ncbi:hypothetical protein [Demequina sp. NBRC 110055]|uniref:hypothetical protein n=1 Tax=Demequina sp. NBRC 110055 TaxID=1570344 RepID=UPI001186B39E|nr:hypothetical protein [Demequina sp. NBRC 110055]
MIPEASPTIIQTLLFVLGGLLIFEAGERAHRTSVAFKDAAATRKQLRTQHTHESMDQYNADYDRVQAGELTSDERSRRFKEAREAADAKWAAALSEAGLTDTYDDHADGPIGFWEAVVDDRRTRSYATLGLVVTVGSSVWALA